MSIPTSSPESPTSVPPGAFFPNSTYNNSVATGQAFQTNGNVRIDTLHLGSFVLYHTVNITNNFAGPDFRCPPSSPEPHSRHQHRDPYQSPLWQVPSTSGAIIPYHPHPYEAYSEGYGSLQSTASPSAASVALISHDLVRGVWQEHIQQILALHGFVMLLDPDCILTALLHVGTSSDHLFDVLRSLESFHIVSRLSHEQGVDASFSIDRDIRQGALQELRNSPSTSRFQHAFAYAAELLHRMIYLPTPDYQSPIRTHQERYHHYRGHVLSLERIYDADSHRLYATDDFNNIRSWRREICDEMQEREA